MTNEQQIAALREGIRQSGLRTAAMRRRVLPASLAGFFVLFVASAELIHPVHNPPDAWIGPDAVAAALLAAVGPAAVLALLASGIYRRGRCDQLRRALSRLPRSSRAKVLFPLPHNESGDTRRIARQLLREFGMPAELAPATAPDAHGYEASPAETPT